MFYKRTEMKEFLTFETFITPTLLIFIYYIGAVVIPIVSWYFVHWIKTAYFSKTDMKGKAASLSVSLTMRQRTIVFTIFLISFLLMEMFWRMIFEFFIAYFDIHDALMKLLN